MHTTHHPPAASDQFVEIEFVRRPGLDPEQPVDFALQRFYKETFFSNKGYHHFSTDSLKGQLISLKDSKHG